MCSCKNEKGEVRRETTEFLCVGYDTRNVEAQDTLNRVSTRERYAQP